MQKLKISAAVLGLLIMISGAAHAQPAAKNSAKAAQRGQMMDAAMERLKDSMSNGGSEGVSGAGSGVFGAMADFSLSGGDDTTAVRSAPMSKAPRKAGLINAAADCWEVCVSFGPLNVCYTWEKRCR